MLGLGVAILTVAMQAAPAMPSSAVADPFKLLISQQIEEAQFTLSIGSPMSSAGRGAHASRFCPGTSPESGWKSNAGRHQSAAFTRMALSASHGTFTLTGLSDCPLPFLAQRRAHPWPPQDSLKIEQGRPLTDLTAAHSPGIGMPVDRAAGYVRALRRIASPELQHPSSFPFHPRATLTPHSVAVAPLVHHRTTPQESIALCASLQNLAHGPRQTRNRQASIDDAQDDARGKRQRSLPQA